MEPAVARGTKIRLDRIRPVSRHLVKNGWCMKEMQLVVLAR